MKAFLTIAGIAAALVLGIGAMADATQNRPDVVDPDSSTTLVFDVGTRRYTGGDDAAALALWAVCASTVGDNEVVAGPAPVADGWSVTLEPALGEHSRKRLAGCLEDGTIDRVRGHVRSLG